jgi:iron complex outermembrane receptor protein
LLPGSYAYADSLSDVAWTPKVGLDVRLANRMLAYGSATRGFKSGGFNLTSPEPGRGYAPEYAWTYEGGLKTTFVDGRALLDVATFVTEYTDLQVQTAIRPGVIDISNAAAATILGVEAESAVQLASAWRAGGHFTWLDATYDHYMAVGVGGITGDASGNQLTNAPEWSGNLWLEWNSRIGMSHPFSVRADSRWQSTVFFTPFNDDIQRQQAHGLLDVSAEVGLRPWFTIGAYARNLTNQDFITGTFATPPPAIGGRPGHPRQMGVRLTVSR